MGPRRNVLATSMNQPVDPHNPALPAEHTVSTSFTRAGYAVSVVVYSFLAWSAMSFATDERAAQGAETEDAKVERFTRQLMDMSAGRWLVGAIGICVVGVGIYFVVKGVSGELPRRSRTAWPRPDRRAADRRIRPCRVGRAGHRDGLGRLVRDPCRDPLPPPRTLTVSTGRCVK